MNQIKIGKFIAQLRHEQNWTQEELGDKIGVTNKTISRWENGVYLPEIEMIQLLSKIFNVSINEIIAGERIPEKSFKEIADENLISAIKNSSFTLKEKIYYFKKKCLKENIALLAANFILLLIIFVYSLLKSITWLIGTNPILWLICYIWLRNRMMIYVERNAFKNL